jgi:hypothetical protein
MVHGDLPVERWLAGGAFGTALRQRWRGGAGGLVAVGLANGVGTDAHALGGIAAGPPGTPLLEVAALGLGAEGLLRSRMP